MSTRIPSLGPSGEGWVGIQFVLIALIAAAGLMAGGAWTGLAAQLTWAAGLALLVAGGTLAVRGLLDLGRGLTPLPRPRDGARIVAHGAYRLVRHPIYGGLVLASIGWAGVTASALAAVLSAVLLAFFDLKSRREEAWLVEHDPGYLEYRAGTRRLIPFVY